MRLYAFSGVRDYQVANGLLDDGIYGKQCNTRADLLDSLNDESRLLLAEIDKDDLKMDDLKRSRPMASAIQEILNLLGYDVGYAKYGADGKFGSASMGGLEAYMRDQVISDHDIAINQLAHTLFRMYGGVKYFRGSVSSGVGETFDVGHGLKSRTYERSGKTRVEITDTESGVKKEFTRFKKGLFTNGTLKVSDLNPVDYGIHRNGFKVISAVAELEGNLDAINTWDNSFISIGCFQWTLGTDDKEGELGQMMLDLKKMSPTFFETKFLKYGFDVDDNGECYINEVALVKKNKDAVRTPEWAFRFWEACQHQEMISRMLDACWKRFRVVLNMKIPSAGMDIQELFKDNYLGYAECLQIHVNRPAYLDNIVTLAIQDAISDPSTPSASKYRFNSPGFQESVLKGVRKHSITYGNTPVTDAAHRFDKVKSFMKV